MNPAQHDGLVDVSLYGAAADVAEVVGLLAGRGELVDQLEPHPGVYGPGEHVCLTVRISEGGRK